LEFINILISLCFGYDSFNIGPAFKNVQTTVAALPRLSKSKLLRN